MIRNRSREKAAAYDRAYREANREKRAAARRSYYEANREKAAAYDRAYREANREKRAAARKAYYEANREKTAAVNRAYREANREKRAATDKAYWKANPEKARVKGHSRRVKMGKGDLSADQWREIVEAWSGRCAYCLRVPAALHLEHMDPLSRGGQHTRSNVVPACPACNFCKGTKTAEEFGAWFLLTR